MEENNEHPGMIVAECNWCLGEGWFPNDRAADHICPGCRHPGIEQQLDSLTPAQQRQFAIETAKSVLPIWQKAFPKDRSLEEALQLIQQYAETPAAETLLLERAAVIAWDLYHKRRYEDGWEVASVVACAAIVSDAEAAKQTGWHAEMAVYACIERAPAGQKGNRRWAQGSITARRLAQTQERSKQWVRIARIRNPEIPY